MDSQFRNGRKCRQTVQTFEIAISPRDTAIGTNMHVDVKTIPEFVSTLCTAELRFSSMHLKYVLFQVRADLKAKSAYWTKAFHQLRVVTGHVFLKIVLGRETHPTRFTFEANTEKMVNIEVLLCVELFLEDNITMSAFESVVRGLGWQLEGVEG